MNERLRVQLVRDASAAPEVVAALLRADGELLAFEGPITDGRLPDATVVAARGCDERVTSLISTSAAAAPGRPVVLVCEGAPNGFTEAAVEAGASDIVVLPQPCGVEQAHAMADQLRFTLQRAVAGARAHPGSGASRGRLVVVLGPKGGSGKTLTATNLAVALAMAGRRVTVVDLDLQFGDVALALGLSPERTVHDLVGSGGSLDAEKLSAFLVDHPSGARALLAPTRPDQAGLVSEGLLRDVCELLRDMNDVVVVDTPPNFTGEVIAAIDSSTDACLVGMLDAPSLKNTRLGLETLDLMGYDRERITLALNRADTRVGITLSDVRSVLGRDPAILIPSAREVIRSVNDGVPIAMGAPRSEAGQAFHKLASLYVPDGQPRTSRRRRLALSRSR